MIPSVTKARQQLREAIKARKERQARRNLILEPKSFGKDYLGVDIVVGATVAYNRSGNVERGTVVEIRRAAVRWGVNVSPKAGDCRIKNVKDKAISSVRWPSSILVISLPLPPGRPLY